MRAATASSLQNRTVGFGSDLVRAGSSDSLFGFAGIFVTIPRLYRHRISRNLSSGFLKRQREQAPVFAGWERDAEVDSRQRRTLGRRQCLLKFFLRVGELLLVHVRHAQGIETQRVRRGALPRRTRGVLDAAGFVWARAVRERTGVLQQRRSPAPWPSPTKPSVIHFGHRNVFLYS